MLARLAPGLAVALLAPFATADTLTVGPTGDFPDIQAAVDAAQDGDVVLVAPGTYGRFVIDGVDVDVIGSGVGVTEVRDDAWVPPSEPPAPAVVHVLNLTAGGEVKLAGMSVVFDPPSGAAAPPIGLANCAGRVLLCDLEVAIEPGTDQAATDPYGSIDVRDCEAVVLSSVVVDFDTVAAEYFAIFGVAEGPSAVYAVRSSVWIADSTLRGATAPGAKGFPSSPPLGRGGAGLSLYDADAWISATTLEGGPVDTTGPFPIYGNPLGESEGGAGARVQHGSRLTVHAGCSLEGGDVLVDPVNPLPGPALAIVAGGAGFPISEAVLSPDTVLTPGDGPNGPGSIVDTAGSSTVSILGERLPTLVAEPDTLPATLPTALGLFLEGEPGATLVLGLTAKLHEPLPLSALTAQTYSLQDPNGVRLVGPFTLDANGDGGLLTVAPGLPAGLTLVLQAFEPGFLGTLASPPVAITVVP